MDTQKSNSGRLPREAEICRISALLYAKPSSFSLEPF